MISKKNIEALANERIDELGKDLFIVAISIGTGNVIRVELESAEGNVAIKDCVSVSRNIEHNLDREEQDFELHVSSAGLDQPLRVIQQFKKNVGRNVKTKLENGSKLEGLLKEATDEYFVVETSRKERLEGKKKKVLVTEDHKINYKDDKGTKIVISFK